MRILASRSALRHFLRWTQRAFFAGGVVILGYCGFVLIDSWIFQQRAGEDLERRLSRERAARSASERPAELPPAVGADGLIGRIEIQRLGLSAIVFEGTDKTTLRRAAGHIPRTGFPGQPGNIGIAGHRDTFFRPLKDIAKEDVIVLTTLRGEFHYRVVWTRVVAPTEVSVLNPAEGEMLTLVTCYPFYFVGSAPERFIVRAERVIFGEAAVNGRQIPTSRPSVDRGRSRIRAQLRLRVCGPSVRRLCLGHSAQAVASCNISTICA